MVLVPPIIAALLNGQRQLLSAALMTAIPLIASCESKDTRLAQFVARANEQQERHNERLAEQSQTVARQSEHLALATRNLVEQDAIARRELLSGQQNLQQQISRERSSLNQQHQQLHQEQVAARQAAIRESAVAKALTTVGLIAAALLPVLVAGYAIHHLPAAEPIDALLLSTLVDDVLERGPVRLPPADQAGTSEGNNALLFGRAETRPDKNDGPSH